MNTKTYYFPDDEIEMSFFGSDYPICVDREEVMRLARGWDEPDLMEHMHEATAAELEEYGVYDSPFPADMPIYWAHDGEVYTGVAVFEAGSSIRFISGTTGDAFDCVENDEPDAGITLDDIWSDLLSQRDETGRLDVTDIQLI